MQIKFKLSRWDVFYSTFVMNFQQPYLNIFIFLFLLWLSYLNWTSISSEYSLIVRVLTVIFLCIPPILLMVGLIAVFIFLVALSKNNEPILAEQKWIVSDDLIGYESEYIHSQIQWKSLKRVISVGSYCFLYFSQMGACIIPKRAFSSDQEWKEFINLCRSKLNK